MRGRLLLLLFVIASLAACATGDSGPGVGTTTHEGSTGGSTGSGGAGGGSGVAPTDCTQADESFGCCFENTLYYCKPGSTTLAKTVCTGSDVCGWNASKGYYACVAAPGGADPSDTHALACP